MANLDLHSASFVFSQEGNTLGTTDAYEQLDIGLFTQLPNTEPFVVIKTTGWSADDGDELKRILDRCVAAFKSVVEGNK